MPALELSTEEEELLRQILENNLSNLRMEIADTDDSSFKAQLRERKEILKAILEKLPQPE